MAYTPSTPYPKGRGDAIRSADWNEAVNEVVRLENDKFNKTGGTVSGSLTVTGTVSGTLANNIVGANQIAGNAVTTAKIVDGNVTAAKIADGNVTINKLANGAVVTEKIADGNVGTTKLDGFLAFNGTFSLAASGSYTFALSGEYANASPRYYNALVFAHPITSGGYISWEQRYYSYDSGGGVLYSYPLLTFTNIYATATDVHARVWLLRGPA